MNALTKTLRLIEDCNRKGEQVTIEAVALRAQV